MGKTCKWVSPVPPFLLFYFTTENTEYHRGFESFLLCVSVSLL